MKTESTVEVTKTEGNEYRRGQIWMVEEPIELSKAKIYTGDKALAYRRACLIIESNDDLSDSGPLITVLPINGSKINENVKETYVSFTNGLGDINRIIVSQPTVKMRSRFSKYLFTVTDETMRCVDDALNKHLGLNNKPIGLLSLFRK